MEILQFGRVTSGGHGSGPPYATMDRVGGHCCLHEKTLNNGQLK